MPEYINLKNGKSVLKSDYIITKTKDLIEFGYENLTEKEVELQLNNLIENNKLSIIGLFIQEDIKI
jgi:hypothetical protein